MLGSQTKMMLVVILMAIVLGGLLCGKIPNLLSTSRERQSIENEHLRWQLEQSKKWYTLEHILVFVLKLCIVVFVVLFTGGLLWQVMVYIAKKSSEIRPGEDGQYPVYRVQAGGPVKALLGSGVTTLVNPNRMLGHTVSVQGTNSGGMKVTEVFAAGDPNMQDRVTARHQAAQLMAAQRGSGDFGADSDMLAMPEHRLLPQGGENGLPTNIHLGALLGNSLPSTNGLILGVYQDDAGQRQVLKASMPALVHVGVGGSSGYGKSTFLRALTYQLVYAQEQPIVLLADLQRTTLAIFQATGRLGAPVAVDADSAAELFAQMAEELEKRAELFGALGVDSLADYNGNVRPEHQLQEMILVADECTSLLFDGTVTKNLRTLALRGRGLGLWLVLAGQNWTTKTIPSYIRDQLSTRIQFKATSKSQSRVLIEDSAAENLSVKGRAVALLPGVGTVEIQTPLVMSADIRRAVGVDVGQKIYGDGSDYIDVIPEPAPELLEQPLVRDDIERAVIEAYKATGSKTGAATQVFGSGGGTNFYKTCEILRKAGLIE